MLAVILVMLTVITSTMLLLGALFIAPSILHIATRNPCITSLIFLTLRHLPTPTPQVLALFSNGRIEQFLDCMTLTPAQMCDDFFIPRIAALLARFHTVQVDLPDPHSSSLFKTIRRWLDMAKHLEFDQPSPKAAAYAALDFAQMEWEVDEVETACLATGSPVVFCHCDLLSGNFLVLQPPGFDPERPDLEGPLTVIDFEYGAYAQRGFDFGNHFNEYAGFECDYTR